MKTTDNTKGGSLQTTFLNTLTRLNNYSYWTAVNEYFMFKPYFIVFYST